MYYHFDMKPLIYITTPHLHKVSYPSLYQAQLQSIITKCLHIMA